LRTAYFPIFICRSLRSVLLRLVLSLLDFSFFARNKIVGVQHFVPAAYVPMHGSYLLNLYIKHKSSVVKGIKIMK